MAEPSVIVPSRDRSSSLINASILFVAAFFLTHIIYLFVTLGECKFEYISFFRRHRFSCTSNITVSRYWIVTAGIQEIV